MNARRRCVSPLPAKCRHESAPRGAARLSVRAPGAPEGRHRPAADRSTSPCRSASRSTPPPPFLLEALRRSCGRLGSYPATAGLPELREACAALADAPLRARGRQRRSGDDGAAGQWHARGAVRVRAGGRRPRAGAPLVLMPNPFYQIYEGAALLAGAQPLLSSTRRAATGFCRIWTPCPDAVWRRCQVLFLCTPGNPTGAVMSPRIPASARSSSPSATTSSSPSTSATPRSTSTRRARRPALLQAALASGRARFERCVVFHSLSKRSSVPGLRSGFVAGDPADPRAVSAVSHLSRLRDAGADAARQHRGLERRRARGREPRALPGEIRARAADPGYAAALEPSRRRLLPVAQTWRGRRALHARAVRDSRTSRCCPAATSRAPSAQGNPGAAACASRSCRRVEDMRRGRRPASWISCAAAGSRARLHRHER